MDRPEPLTILYRRAGTPDWHELGNARELRMAAHEDGGHCYDLVSDPIDPARPRQELEAQVIVVQHYPASHDLRFLPRATLAYHGDWKVEGSRVRIISHAHDAPDLPVEYRMFEHRTPTHLSITAKPHDLETLMDAFRANEPLPKPAPAASPAPSAG